MNPSLTITIRPTPEIVPVEGTLARVWHGVTAGGVECRVLVAAVAVRDTADESEFERELTAIADPLPPGVTLT